MGVSAALAPLAKLRGGHPWVLSCRSPMVLVLYDAVIVEPDAGWPAGGVQLVGLLRGGDGAVSDTMRDLRRRYAGRLFVIAPLPGQTEFAVTWGYGDTQIHDGGGIPFAEAVRRWL